MVNRDTMNELIDSLPTNIPPCHHQCTDLCSHDRTAQNNAHVNTAPDDSIESNVQGIVTDISDEMIIHDIIQQIINNIIDYIILHVDDNRSNEFNHATHPADITLGVIGHLLHYFIDEYSINTARCRLNPTTTDICNRVTKLYEIDYNINKLYNYNNEYCSTYPSEIIIIESYLGTPSHIINHTNRLKTLFHSSRFNRVHGRFVVPVLLYKSHNICRSSTLAIQAEALMNNVYSRASDFFSSFYTSTTNTNHNHINSSTSQQSYHSPPKSDSYQSTFSLFNMESARTADIELLDELHIQHICDFMMESRKRKAGVALTSSEKAEIYRYYSYHINVLPYCGCEHFTVYKYNSYNAQQLMFDWSASYINAQLNIASIINSKSPSGTVSLNDTTTSIQWTKYRDWDLIELTQNYMLLLLNTLVSNTAGSTNNGVLLHCVSGWDRTPLFVSLLRISLWADGECHQSLSSIQILYLTLAYDWCLFSHQLNDRLVKGEEIMRWCFDFLQYIIGDQYSINTIEQQHITQPNTNTGGDQSPVTQQPGAADFSIDLDTTQSIPPTPELLHVIPDDALHCPLPDDEPIDLLHTADDDYFLRSSDTATHIIDNTTVQASDSEPTRQHSALTTALRDNKPVHKIPQRLSPPSLLKQSVSADALDIVSLPQSYFYQANVSKNISSNNHHVTAFNGSNTQPISIPRASRASSNGGSGETSNSIAQHSSWTLVADNVLYNDIPNNHTTTAVSLSKSLSKHNLVYRSSMSNSSNDIVNILSSTTLPTQVTNNQTNSPSTNARRYGKIRHDSTRSQLSDQHDDELYSHDIMYNHFNNHSSNKSTLNQLHSIHSSSPSTSQSIMDSSFVSLSPAYLPINNQRRVTSFDLVDDHSQYSTHSPSITAISEESIDSPPPIDNVPHTNFNERSSNTGPLLTDQPSTSPPHTPTLREQRLLEVRSLFLQVYNQCVCTDYKNMTLHTQSSNISIPTNNASPIDTNVITNSAVQSSTLLSPVATTADTSPTTTCRTSITPTNNNNTSNSNTVSSMFSWVPIPSFS